MILTRDKGQRMWGGSFEAGGGGGGGMSPGALAGYATQAWVDENYVSSEYFKRLFQAFNGSTAVNPNDLTTAITNIKAMVDFWSAGGVSALGYNSGGGGGGATALTDLVDVQLTTPVTNGQALVYNSTTGKWENTTIQASGGTVTSVGLSMPTGFAVASSPITSSGIIAVTFSSGYALPTTADVTKGVTAYGWGNHASAGYWGTSNHPTTLAGYGITDAISTNSTWWGRSMVNGAVTGDMTSVGGITMSGSINMDAAQYIAFNDGGYKNVLTFNNSILSLGYGTRKNGRTTQIHGNTLTFRVASTENGIDAMTIDANGRCYIPVAAQGLRIGDGLITWDSANSALKVTKYDNTAANFYALGGVSALGMSTNEVGMIIGALPLTGEQGIVYRVPGNGSYSDYMWNGSDFVLLATYSTSYDAGGALS